MKDMASDSMEPKNPPEPQRASGQGEWSDWENDAFATDEGFYDDDSEQPAFFMPSAEFAQMMTVSQEIGVGSIDKEKAAQLTATNNTSAAAKSPDIQKQERPADYWLGWSEEAVS